MLTFMVEHAFAGLWSMIWHFGVGIGLVILLLAAAYFSPIGKKEFIYAAVVVLAFLGGETMGVHLEKVHTDAQAAAVEKYVTGVVKGTGTPKSKAQKDPYDNPKN